MWPRDDLAQVVGQELGEREVLFRRLSIQKEYKYKATINACIGLNPNYSVYGALNDVQRKT